MAPSPRGDLITPGIEYKIHCYPVEMSIDNFFICHPVKRMRDDVDGF